MKSRNKGKDFCVFALPGLFCFLAVVMVPFIYGIYLTLTDWNGVSSVIIGTVSNGRAFTTSRI